MPQLFEFPLISIPLSFSFALLSWFIVLQSCFSYHFIIVIIIVHFFLCMVASKLPAPSPPVDVWSVGCIIAEMIRGSVLFPGTDRILPRHWFITTSLSAKTLGIIHRVLALFFIHPHPLYKISVIIARLDCTGRSSGQLKPSSVLDVSL